MSETERQLAYWLERSSALGNLDAPLLDVEGVRDHNLALGVSAGDRPLGQADLSSAPDRGELWQDVRERLEFLRQRFASGAYVARDGAEITGARLARYDAPEALPQLTPSLRVVTADVPLRCGPELDGFFTPSLDLDFDRNDCSTLHAQEPVQVLADWGGGVLLARSRYAMGFIAADAPLSPAADAATRAVLLAPRAELLRDHTFEGAGAIALPAGALLPITPGGVLLATSSGFEARPVPEGLTRPTSRPLTRRALLKEAFRWLDAPYGWGGHAGGRDCSRFLLDVFESFGLHLPRHSGRQALAGTFSIDVSGVERAEEKLPLLDAALRRGAVLLHFPGHIMFYLGRDRAGVPMVLHSFSEYVVPCAGSADEGEPLETLRRVDRVAISDLSLGEGSSRGSFLERITRIVVLGRPPGPSLAGVASLRPAAAPPAPSDDACEDSSDDAIFRTPKRPWPGARLRVIATSLSDPGPVTLAVYGPDGARVEAQEHVLGGPPFSRWVELPRPVAGGYRAVLGDGEHVVACERFGVARRHAPEPDPRTEEAPAWEPVWHWEHDTEDLYAAFVEQLFRDPVDGDVTFSSLSEVLRDPARNLLYDHLGLDEDEQLSLRPDCADLPYFLRAYFSWKLRLPFGFRQCNRGRPGRPPRCGELRTNLENTPGRTSVEAFSRFLRRLGSGVHSASGRTAPDDDRTDYYPLPLERETLPPGTVFADPYGHVLIVAGYRPQGLHESGALIGADAQPDGTVGRRRFWRGSFLFTPETGDVGAGFKAFRPLSFDRESGEIVAPTNRELSARGPHLPYSRQQYEGSVDDFYERMEAVIDPRPVDAQTRMRTLVDALEEAVIRRVVSVNNGESYVAEHPGRSVEMPEGYSIFETEGPWEDFSTPSRDMRLLISLDAVLGFPQRVGRSPERFGVSDAQAESVARELESLLRSELAARHFDYRRSDGSVQSLSLADIAARARGFELAYNPNDCVERRWAAPEDSAELSSCRRHAPAAQRQRMLRYRPWFRERQRPAR
ncbi:MAG: hypothetical protein GXP55_02120 [Deltaproteobacteria bacterium]|nr:hypothetical protein [Deltaproteobacteria bacterium]